MSAIPSHRVFIVLVLLVTAVAGALLRSFSAPQSTPYYVGTLLMVMWVPIVGNIISFIVNRFRRAAPEPPSFSEPFVPHVGVELKLQSEQSLDLPREEQDGRIHCLFISGTEGFSARVSLRKSHAAVSKLLPAEAQFLVPAVALPKFPIGATFLLMQGRSSIGTGQVLSLPPN